MAIKYSTVASKVIPVLATWECSKCHEKNNASGVYLVSVESTSARGDIVAKKSAKEYLDNIWKDTALDTIVHPENNVDKLRQGLSINPCKCKKCNKKEIWAKMSHPILTALVLQALIVTLIMALFKSVVGIILFIIFLGIFILLLYDVNAGKRIKNKPIVSLPKLTCFNTELIMYGDEKGYNLHSPAQAVVFLYYYENVFSLFSNDYDYGKMLSKPVDEQSFMFYCKKCGQKFSYTTPGIYSHRCSDCGEELLFTGFLRDIYINCNDETKAQIVEHWKTQGSIDPLYLSFAVTELYNIAKKYTEEKGIPTLNQSDLSSSTEFVKYLADCCSKLKRKSDNTAKENRPQTPHDRICDTDIDEKESSIEKSNVVFCYKCGNKLIDGSVYCSKCGAKVTE